MSIYMGSQLVSGGVTDYDGLSNHPSINSVELVGNKTSADLGLANSTVDLPVETLSGTITLQDNSARGIIASDAIVFSLPTVTDYTILHEIFAQLKLSTVYSVDLGLGSTPHWLTETAPDLSKAGTYNLYWEYDNINQYWKAGALKQGTGS